MILGLWLSLTGHSLYLALSFPRSPSPGAFPRGSFLQLRPDSSERGGVPSGAAPLAGSVAAPNTHQSRTGARVWHFPGAVARAAGRPEAALAAQPPSLTCPAEGHVSCRGTRAARPAPRAGTSDSFGPARGCKLLTSEARCLALLDQSKPSGLASSPPSFLGPTDSCSNLSPWSCQEIQGWSL